jgi:hypothetical protein
MLNCAIDLTKILGHFEHMRVMRIANLAQKLHMMQYPRGSRHEAHVSKFRGRTLKQMSGMCKKEDRKGDAKTSIR